VLVLAAVMIAASASIHLYLWGEDDGYRAVPTIGPLFLAQGASGCLLAVAIVAARRFVVTAAGCVYMAFSVGGLYMSMHGGLFGYPETVDAPWVKTTLLVELIGLVAGIGACWSALSPETEAING
jgi:hypothetical protein